MPDNSVLLYAASEGRWLLFRNPRKLYVARDIASVVPMLRQVECMATRQGLYAAGFVAYEASPAFDSALKTRAGRGFPLLWFGLYNSPEPAARPATAGGRPPELDWRPSVSETEYGDRFRAIKEYIRAGDCYQVNYTYRLRAATDSPLLLFPWMVRAQGDGYAAAVNMEDGIICSASPELFFVLRDGIIESRPMKGTAERGLDSAADRRQRELLRRSEKDRAENLMITDMVRNDMGKIAVPGTVKTSSLFAAERYPTVWQMTSTVRCRTAAGLVDIFRALFPAASITGAPKCRTMEIIADLEPEPRNIYTGTIGYFGPRRRAQFNVAIRTVWADKRSGTAEYGVGGGIVWDSQESLEMRECSAKTRVLTRVLPDFELLETILWRPDNGYRLLDGHLARLVESADYFGRRVNISTVNERLAELQGRLSGEAHKVRLLVDADGEPSLEAGRLPALPAPYRLKTACAPVDSTNVFLYHKTTCRDVYRRALAGAPGGDDVLLWNERGEITETCIANVVFEREGRLYTPPVSCGLLPGVFRSLLLKDRRVREEVLPVAELPDCSRLYLANSVRGLWEVDLPGMA